MRFSANERNKVRKLAKAIVQDHLSVANPRVALAAIAEVARHLISQGQSEDEIDRGLGA